MRIKKITAILLLSAFISLTIPNQKVFAKNINVMREQKILTKITELTKSEKVKSGHEINAVTFSSLVVNDKIIFEKNIPVKLIATEVIPRKFAGQGGLIKIEQAIIKDSRGIEHTFNVNQSVQGKTRDWVIVCMCLSSTIILIPFLLFGFVKGETAIIPDGMIIECSLQDTFLY